MHSAAAGAAALIALRSRSSAARLSLVKSARYSSMVRGLADIAYGYRLKRRSTRHAQTAKVVEASVIKMYAGSLASCRFSSATRKTWATVNKAKIRPEVMTYAFMELLNASCRQSSKRFLFSQINPDRLNIRMPIHKREKASEGILSSHFEGIGPASAGVQSFFPAPAAFR